jgi:Domain of unknown function (DUF4440)
MFRGGVMNRVLVCSLIIVLTSVAGFTQAPAANHAAIEKQILANERAVNEAFAKGDLKAFHANVAPDAVSVDAGGIMKVNTPDFDKMLQTTKIQTWNIDGSQFYWVNDNTVVHMYRWTGKGSYEGQPIPSPTWASTIWANKAGKWMAVFHQEVLAMGPPPAPAKSSPAKK